MPINCDHPEKDLILVSFRQPSVSGFLVCPVQDCISWTGWSKEGAPPPRHSPILIVRAIMFAKEYAREEESVGA